VEAILKNLYPAQQIDTSPNKTTTIATGESTLIQGQGQMITASNLELKGDSPYDLIMMDLFMPQMDGLQATRVIRSHPLIPRDLQPFIIALTANAMQGDVDKCFEAGMDMYLSKPISSEPLTNAIRTIYECLQQQNTVNQIAAKATPSFYISPSTMVRRIALPSLFSAFTQLSQIPSTASSSSALNANALQQVLQRKSSSATGTATANQKSPDSPASSGSDNIPPALPPSASTSTSAAPVRATSRQRQKE